LRLSKNDLSSLRAYFLKELIIILLDWFTLIPFLGAEVRLLVEMVGFLGVTCWRNKLYVGYLGLQRVYRSYRIFSTLSLSLEEQSITISAYDFLLE
jgi:hypothetical protein